MTKEQLNALIDFIRNIASTAISDPTCESGTAYQAEKQLRKAFEEDP